jgi:restriction system protein
MPIPDFQTIMLPLLDFCNDGEVHTSREAYDALAKRFNLTEEERSTLLSSGKQPLFHNRVLWARFYLDKAGLIESPSRGAFRITSEGQKVLKQKPKTITEKSLLEIPRFREFRHTKETTEKTQAITGIISPLPRTPEELINDGYQELRETLAEDVLSRVKSCSPRFFEKLVVELLLKMGYGGSLKEAGQVIGKSGDGGIDGIIKEDKLGLDVVYIQAKRWDGAVPAHSVRDFSGSLDYHGAKKGVFITTSTFTNDAKQFVGKIGEKKIVLIDGFELAQLMMDYDVGVTTVNTYAVKRIDSDYFEEE